MVKKIKAKLIKVKITKYNFYSGKNQKFTKKIPISKYKELKRYSKGKFSNAFKITKC